MASKYFRQKRKPGARKKKSDAPFSEDIQGALAGFLSEEYDVAARNTEKSNQDFTEYYEMIHCVRSNKPNEWESDIYLPEFVSRLLTQIGNFVQQYFSSRDYVETVEDSENPEDIAEAKASKRLLNILLNDKKAHYFAKLVRLLMFVFPSGRGVIKGGYSQEIENRFRGYRTQTNYVESETGEILAEDGSVYADSLRQRPMQQSTEIPVYENEIIEDRPVFDVYPNQYVHTSPEYAYSLQDKEYVIFETRKTVDGLYADKTLNGYFNLHLLENLCGDHSLKQHDDKTVNVDGDKEQPTRPILKPFVICERWGKFPCIVERNEYNQIISAKPGINKNMEIEDNTENIECIIAWAKTDGVVKNEQNHNDLPGPSDIIIRFQHSPHSKRPMVRFNCYIDPLKDEGFGDGEVNRELQTASNDMYNLSNYRTQLATTPAFLGKRFSGLPKQIRVSPEEVTFLEGMEDLKELVIKDDIHGAMSHIGMLGQKMDYAMATSPVTMGMEPLRRETATMGAIMDRRASVRIGMKSMTLEFVGFTEFYDMLLTLCNDFMLPETLFKLIGDDAKFYNPERDDRFKPVTQAIETEESKNFKIKMWDQVLGRVVSIPNPKTPLVVNYILGQILELMGGDFKHFKKFMFSEDIQSNILYQLATGGGLGGSTPNGADTLGAPSNQTGLPMGTSESQTRGMQIQ